jgi:hypothetical protein
MFSLLDYNVGFGFIRGAHCLRRSDIALPGGRLLLSAFRPAFAVLFRRSSCSYRHMAGYSKTVAVNEVARGHTIDHFLSGQSCNVGGGGLSGDVANHHSTCVVEHVVRSCPTYALAREAAKSRR